MVRPSTSKDEQYNIYELHATLKHSVTAGQETDKEIVLTGIAAHAIVDAGATPAGNVNYARAYVNGTLVTITSVTTALGNTTVVFPVSTISEDDIVDIYFPVLAGKMDLPRIQKVQGWKATTNRIMVEECGTERLEPVDLRETGVAVLGLYRFGNDAMAAFAAAHEGDSDGVKTPLLIDVTDSTVATATHELLFPATVATFNRVATEADSKQGLISDTITFKFALDVVTL